MVIKPLKEMVKKCFSRLDKDEAEEQMLLMPLPRILMPPNEGEKGLGWQWEVSGGVLA